MDAFRKWLHGAKMSLFGWQTVDEKSLVEKLLREFSLGKMGHIKLRTDHWSRTWCKCIMS